MTRLLLRSLLGGMIAAALLLGVEQLASDSGPGPDRAEAHRGTLRQAVRLMRGSIADECPGGNHLICFERHDAYVYKDPYSRDCWKWNTGYTHREGNNPWVLKRWYGSRGAVCHGTLVWHQELR